MYLHDFLDSSAIKLDLTSSTKDEVLDEMVALLGLDERSTHQLGRLLKRRELLGSTGVGRGIAIPHCRSLALSRLRLAFNITYYYLSPQLIETLASAVGDGAMP